MLRSLLLASTAIAPLLSVEWTLLPIAGHAPDVWAEGANWRWDDGNPRRVDGGSWSLLYQPEPGNPALKPMVKGMAWNYNRVWRDDGAAADPQTCYIDTKLNAGSRPDGPGDGPVSAIVFAPTTAGRYRIEVAGTIAMQSPTAGNARLELTVCAATDGAPVRVVTSAELNQPGGHGSFPAEIAWDAQAEIAANQAIAVRLCTVNPGPATAGRCGFAFSRLRVSRD